MENVALDGRAAVELDAVGMDGALDAAADAQIVGDDVAFDFGAWCDLHRRGAQLALDPAEYLDGSLTGDFSDDGHAGADGGFIRRRRISRRRRCRRRPRTLLDRRHNAVALVCTVFSLTEHVVLLPS